MALLEASQVYGGYGGADILKGVDVSVGADEVVVLAGPNGAGKSTVMKAVFGLVRVRSGSIRFDDSEIANLAPEKIVRRGACYVPQEHNVFPTLTVRENLEMGAYLRRRGIEAKIEQLCELFPRLAERRRQPVGQMSGGERQMVAMARALMLDPKLLLLDEPTAGLAPKFIDQVFDQVKQVNALGIGVLMVEQNAKQALGVADRGYVLATGRNRFHDSAANLLANREVAEMFLGG